MIRGKLRFKQGVADVLSLAPSDLILQMRRGLGYSHISRLQSVIDVPLKRIAELAGVAPRTLMRRRRSGRFSSDESERLLRLSRVVQLTVSLFEDDLPAARNWLLAPRDALDGNSPLEYARTEIGAREVENLIGRLEHGVFS